MDQNKNKSNELTFILSDHGHKLYLIIKTIINSTTSPTSPVPYGPTPTRFLLNCTCYDYYIFILIL